MKELNPSTTPVVFSRGLMPEDGSDGKWGFIGVWHDEGGFIGFLDGQVRWYKDINGDDGDGVLSSDSGSINNVSNFLSSLGLNYCHESSYSS
jgi:hypothetical protein